MKQLQYMGNFDLDLLRIQLLDKYPGWRTEQVVDGGVYVVETLGFSVLGNVLTVFVPDDANEVQMDIAIQLHDPSAGKPVDWVDIVASRNAFSQLPNWATWTPAEASAFVTNQIFGGWDETQVEAWVNANVTTLATAKTAMITMGKEMIQQRDLVAKMAEAIMYIRNILLKKVA